MKEKLFLKANAGIPTKVRAETSVAMMEQIDSKKVRDLFAIYFS